MFKNLIRNHELKKALKPFEEKLQEAAKSLLESEGFRENVAAVGESLRFTAKPNLGNPEDLTAVRSLQGMGAGQGLKSFAKTIGDIAKGTITDNEVIFGDHVLHPQERIVAKAQQVANDLEGNGFTIPEKPGTVSYVGIRERLAVIAARIKESGLSEAGSAYREAKGRPLTLRGEAAKEKSHPRVTPPASDATGRS